MEGKVPTVFHDSTDDAQAVNFKKAIAATFQANFMGTEQEEETDPQSKHISYYRWVAMQSFPHGTLWQNCFVDVACPFPQEGTDYNSNLP